MLAVPVSSSLITIDGALVSTACTDCTANGVAVGRQVGRHIGCHVDREVALEVRRRRRHQRVGDLRLALLLDESAYPVLPASWTFGVVECFVKGVLGLQAARHECRSQQEQSAPCVVVRTLLGHKYYPNALRHLDTPQM